MQNTLFSVGLLACLCSGAFSSVDYPAITIDLQNNPPGHQITGFHTLTNLLDTRINVLNINYAVGFFLIQVHSYLKNITLSYDSDSQASGTNIGLIWKANSANAAQFYLFRDHIAQLDNIEVFIAVSTYSKYDPVPGGCNLSFETEIAPYQKINESDDYITVSSQPPSLFGDFCNQSKIVTRMYYLYLPEHNNSTEQYFASIEKMISVDDILKYGTRVPEGLAPNRFKQKYNRYAGTGRVFAVVSSYLGGNAAYVPAVSYGCDLAAWDSDCAGPVGTQWKIATAFLLLCGLFICFGGHRFFNTGLFIIAYAFGVIFMLTTISIFTRFGEEGREIFSLISGVVFAGLWVFLWRKFGIPVIAVQLAFLLTGLLVVSILFYSQLGDIYIFANDATFWTCFVCLLIVTQLPLVCLTSPFYIIALSLLGSYAFIFAVNYYVGGNLPYILLNTYRRITVANFGSAVIAPPYQAMDICQTVLWVVIFGVGVYIQTKHSMGKPPFPPHRADRAGVDENTPLIEPEQEEPPAYSAVLYC